MVSAKMLAVCLHMMKGTPYIYQGEEIGMTNTHFTSLEDCRDIEEINAYRQYVTELKITDDKTMLRCFDTVARDNARTPMQWDDSENAGFTTGTPWIPVNPNFKTINAEAAQEDPDSVFWFYRDLIRLRHTYPVIVYGSFEPLMEESEAVYAYRRRLGDQVLTVACNWTDQDQACGLFEEGGMDLISNYKTHREGILGPYEARVMLGKG